MNGSSYRLRRQMRLRKPHLRHPNITVAVVDVGMEEVAVRDTEVAAVDEVNVVDAVAEVEVTTALADTTAPRKVPRRRRKRPTFRPDQNQAARSSNRRYSSINCARIGCACSANLI